MSTYTDSKSNVIFNNAKNRGLKVSGGPIMINGLTGTDPDDGTGIINAIDIDWNGAQFANAVAAITEVPDAGEVQSANSSITTTGELISIVAKQQKQIDALITMVKGLYASLVS